MAAATKVPSSSAHNSRPSTPTPPIQPAYFFPRDDRGPPSPDSKGYLDPDDDPNATRGIPVFEPTMDEFQDFEGYMMKVECWGNKSGIVKIVPPKEWTKNLNSIVPLLQDVQLKHPIEQHMLGRGGLFQQNNVEKRRTYSVREWSELCNSDGLKPPSRQELEAATGRGARAVRRQPQPKERATSTPLSEPKPDDEPAHLATPPASVADTHDEDEDDEMEGVSAASPPKDEPVSLPTPPGLNAPLPTEELDKKAAARAAKVARVAARQAQDDEWLKNFDPATHWLPDGMRAEDYTPEFCKLLERHYWRNCGLGKPPMYGADMQGSLFSDEIKHWNVASLPSALSRLLPSSKSVPGVNTPYLYWGMWRATFAWHVEDMDLFSINYIHHGAPKNWYAVPQNRSKALETTMRGYFPTSASSCPQFLRHKSFLASPTLLSQSSVRPNVLVQHAGEFVVTFPRGYHAGFNLGFNCAESVNFALESWIDIARKAGVCTCVSDSVRIDVDQLLAERDAENEDEDIPIVDAPSTPAPARRMVSKPSQPRKRKPEVDAEGRIVPTPPKRPKVESSEHTNGSLPVLKIRLKRDDIEPLPCCLCISSSMDGLLEVAHPPSAAASSTGTKPGKDGWMAHEACAKTVHETWVDEVAQADGSSKKMVFGVDCVPRDRWNLKCSNCVKSRLKAHGAPVQCTKGKCPKAFHVSCARDEETIMFVVHGEVERVLVHSHQRAPDSLNPDIEGMASTVEDSTYTTETKISKYQIELHCPQHNRAVLEKKAAERDQLNEKKLLDILASSDPHVRIRSASGVFEVSLKSVDVAGKWVTVAWDGGSYRDFKWGSVVWSTEGNVPQKGNFTWRMSSGTAKVKAVGEENGDGKDKGAKNKSLTWASPVTPSNPPSRAKSNLPSFKKTTSSQPQASGSSSSPYTNQPYESRPLPPIQYIPPPTYYPNTNNGLYWAQVSAAPPAQHVSYEYQYPPAAFYNHAHYRVPPPPPPMGYASTHTPTYIPPPAPAFASQTQRMDDAAAVASGFNGPTSAEKIRALAEMDPVSLNKLLTENPAIKGALDALAASHKSNLGAAGSAKVDPT
ncbi:JmjC-domain-containing protein [Sistotremastrum niveocremeum HHB9708]|uniref:[histone H3]-trimethyl-L-lysine(9) demethylase n=1 Tax=Sistotremastrum niveocremeum HHB9708 TaxID=1314777 RepID=A0A164Y4C9_9AGAM|nr:JmjC-domain-containing protein [Sistotremastrum niveocremeum HHB9708]